MIVKTRRARTRAGWLQVGPGGVTVTEGGTERRFGWSSVEGATKAPGSNGDQRLRIQLDDPAQREIEVVFAPAIDVDGLVSVIRGVSAGGDEPSVQSCRRCGRTMGTADRFCPACGLERGTATTTSRPCSESAWPDRMQQSPPPWTTPSAATAVPPEVVLVVALLSLSGLFLLVPALALLPGALDALGSGTEFGRAFGALVLIAILLVGASGAACLCLATMVWRADRVGRLLTVVLAGVMALSLIAADDRDMADTIALLLAIGTVFALCLMPNARSFFTEPNARQYRQPEPVIAARALLVGLAFILGLVGLLFLPVGSVDGKYYVIGLAVVAISVVLFTTNVRIGAGDPGARTTASVLMGGYGVLLLLAELQGTGLLLPLSLALAVPALLWLPQSSQAHFASRTHGQGG